MHPDDIPDSEWKKLKEEIGTYPSFATVKKFIYEVSPFTVNEGNKDQYLNNCIEDMYLQIEAKIQEKVDTIAAIKTNVDKLVEDGEEDEEGKEDFSSKRRRATCLHCPHAFHIIFISHTPALQHAWNMDIMNITQKCSNCFTPNSQYRCSCCQLVRYCNLSCQSTASEIPGNV